MKIGLTLGKYAPLHRGHQHVIETALSEVDELIVLIYVCPELDVPPLPVRAGWIRQLYPQVSVLEAWDGPTQVSLDPAITAQHDAYLRRRLGGRGITHFYSSEAYGKHVSQALGCIDRRVDEARGLYSTSGTQIRSNLWANRQYLDTIVWRDYVVQVVFLGAPSTGKTTIAQELASRHSTVWMPEYGREYWEQNQIDRRLTLDQLVEIARGHRQREDQLIRQADGYFFIDTDASTTLQFSYAYHDAAKDELIQLAHEARDRYDLFFLCGTDIPYDDTWDRSGDVSRLLMQRRIESDLLSRRVPFHRLTGNLEQRCQRVEEELATLKKVLALDGQYQPAAPARENLFNHRQVLSILTTVDWVGSECPTDSARGYWFDPRRC